jgi:hypothetical protein
MFPAATESVGGWLGVPLLSLQGVQLDEHVKAALLPEYVVAILLHVPAQQ